MPLASVIAEVTALPMRGHLIKRQQASSLHKGAFVGRRPVQRAHVRRKFMAQLVISIKCFYGMSSLDNLPLTPAFE